MITSEVQRTLVKSPPELWTELSDPDALARHLGELGEIRITRTEPERLVEWEAAGTTGTVAIQASAWGTKVTLRVAREIQAPDPAVEQPAAAAEPLLPPSQNGEEARAETAEHDGGDPVGAEDQIALGAHRAPSEDAPASADPTDGDPVAWRDAAAPPAFAQGEAPAEPVEDLSPPAETVEDAAPAAAATATRPGPVTEAARRAAGWTPDDPFGAEIECGQVTAAQLGELPGAEAGGSTPGEELAAAQQAGAVEASEPEPRRGFLARLFGRRRRALPEQPAPSRTDEERLPGAVTAGAPEAQTTPEPPEDTAVIAETAAPEPAGAMTGISERADTQQPAVTEPSPPGPDPDPDQPAAENAEEPTAQLEHDAAEPPAAISERPLSPQPAAAEPSAGATGSEQPGAPGREPAESAAPSPATADLAAELKAAEEIAAEEVKAVLTGVLDRLGAAHHRPFSRS